MKDFLLAWTPLLCLAYIFQSSVAFLTNCTAVDVTFVRRQNIALRIEQLPTAELIEVHESPPSECFGLCNEDRNCSAYFVSYRNRSCVIVRNLDARTLDEHLIQDASSSYHRKVCLPGLRCRREWAFDVTPGLQLFHYHDKTIPGVTSEDDCMVRCAAESTFLCRSARFDTGKSLCVLSRHDRRSAPEFFRQSPRRKGEVLYLESQCVQEPGSCRFRQSRRSRTSLRIHRHVEVATDVTSRDACEEACTLHQPFPCRSYEFAEVQEGVPLCLLSPEDSFSEAGAGPGPRMEDEGDGKAAEMFEKESCIDVEVRCEGSSLTAVVRVSTPFRGRVYAAGHPYDCYSVSVSPEGRVTLAMPLRGSHCGTRNLGNGTFVNSIVVQHHPFVLRTSDRRIDVACDYEEMRMKIRGAKGVRHGELKPLSHTVTAVAPTPPIRLRVVNATDQDVSGVELGDPLFLKVELTDESVYGIFGSDLVARSNGGSETVLLINDDGCPVEPTVIQALDRLPGSKSLVAPFQAFKFASDSAVKFQMTVSYCLDTCPPADCEVPRSSQTQSYGRRRRSAPPLGGLRPGDVVVDVAAESPAFLVNSLGAARDTELREQPLQVRQPLEGHVRLKPQGLCVSMTTLYASAAAIAVLQLAIIVAMAYLFFRRSSESGFNLRNNMSTKSWPSISSRRQLVSSKS